MSTPERVPRIAEQDEESSSHQEANVSIETRPRTHRRTKRFEIGFFIRKVVNGWVVFYKQFPPEDRARVHAQEKGLVPREPQEDQAPEYGQPVMMAMSSQGSVSTDPGGTVTPQDSLGPGGGDPGPVGSTRVEVGFFASTTVESTDDDKA